MRSTPYRLVKDHLGSVRFVIDVVSGAVVQELAYDSWGRMVLDTSPGLQPFGFAGGLYEAETGLVRFGARDYDPEIGRWTSKDPVRFEGGINLYRYARGNPVKLRDPTGLCDTSAGGCDSGNDGTEGGSAVAQDDGEQALQQRLDIFRERYEEWWDNRGDYFRRFGPLSNFLKSLGSDGPTCDEYAAAAAEHLNNHVSEPGMRAASVWNYDLREPETQPFFSHNSVKIIVDDDNGNVVIVETFDPWWRPW